MFASTRTTTSSRRLDVNKAHQNSRVTPEDGDHFIALAEEMVGGCAKPRRWLAAQSWDQDHCSHDEEAGMERRKAPQTFRPKRWLLIMEHPRLMWESNLLTALAIFGDDGEDTGELTKEASTGNRREAARASYLAVNRADIQCAVKESC